MSNFVYCVPRLFRRNTFTIAVASQNRRHISTPAAGNQKVPRIFSGIQPTGSPHIGNYFGAIRQWVNLQNSGDYKDVIVSVVDLHSITLPQEPRALRHNIMEMVACLIACGIDPKRSILFQQSRVPEHAELGWILGCFTTLARLEHLPQWKEKSEGGAQPMLGIFTYPVLQSADILLYKATDVPVGDDQVKHIELTRDLAKKFNKTYKSNVLIPPSALVGNFKRIRSLRYPNHKMSKSEVDHRGLIQLTDQPFDIQDKVRKAVTDSISHITYDPVKRPGISNLVEICAAFSDKFVEDVIEEAAGWDTLKFKQHVADVIIEKVQPIEEESVRILGDKWYLDMMMDEGANKARAIAAETLAEVKKLVGMSI